MMAKYLIIFSLFPVFLLLSARNGPKPLHPAAAAQTDSTIYKAGAKIYRRNCSVCHSLKQDMIGSSLSDIITRRSKAWIYQFISDDEAMLKTDSLAREIYNRNPHYGPSHHFKDEISPQQFEQLMYFLETATKK